MTRSALKAIFTKFEYFLLKRQKEFVIDSESSTISDDNYFKSKEALSEQYVVTPRFELLLTGAKRSTTSKELSTGPEHSILQEGPTLKESMSKSVKMQASANKCKSHEI